MTAFTSPVRKRLTRKDPDPFQEDEDVKKLRERADEALDKPTPGPQIPRNMRTAGMVMCRDSQIVLFVLKTWISSLSFCKFILKLTDPSS